MAAAGRAQRHEDFLHKRLLRMFGQSAPPSFVGKQPLANLMQPGVVLQSFLSIDPQLDGGGTGAGVGASGAGASGVGASGVGASGVGASGVGASGVGASGVGASGVG